MVEQNRICIEADVSSLKYSLCQLPQHFIGWLLLSFCFCHSKFGNIANKCSQPCRFQKNRSKSINTIDPPVTNIPLSEATSLPKICDKISGMLFLLDTGACSNFQPSRDSDTNKEETHSQFLTANGTPIKCFGKTDLETDIGFGKTRATFRICAIEQPVLGFHFMRLALDTQLGCLRCPDTEIHYSYAC